MSLSFCAAVSTRQQPAEFLSLRDQCACLSISTHRCHDCAQVHLMYRKALPLTGFDEECRAHVAENMRLRGINIYSETSPTKCVCLERWALLPFHHSRSFWIMQLSIG